MRSTEEGNLNRFLSIKQYCKDKPTKWGIKTFLLTNSENGYLYSAEVYTGKASDSSEREELCGANGNIVRHSLTKYLSGSDNTRLLGVRDGAMISYLTTVKFFALGVNVARYFRPKVV